MSEFENNQIPPPEIPPAAPPRRRWRRYLLNSFLLLIALVLALVVVALFFNEPVTRMVLKEVNKSLKYDMKVGDIELSLLSGFPNASVNLHNVQVRDAFGGSLLSAEEMSFRFSLASLFGDQIRVHTVLIRDGKLQARVNSKGVANYDIVKPAGSAPKTPGSDSNLKLALENAELRNMNLLYDNALKQQSVSMQVKSAFFSGNFSETHFNLASNAKITTDYIDLDGHRYLAGKPLRYEALIAVDLNKGLYNLQGVDLTVGGNTFSLGGTALSKNAYTDLDLQLTSDEGDISVVFDLLPDAYHAYFNDFSSRGQYSCKGIVKGRLSKSSSPAMTLEVSMRNGSVSSEKLQSPLRNVSFTARFDARPDSPGFFEIDKFHGTFGGQPFDLGLKVDNLNDPVIDFQCSGTLPLAASYGLFNDPAVSSGEGLIYLDSLHVRGRYADMESMSRVSAVDARGAVRFANARVVYNKVPVNIELGTIRLQNNIFSADTLRVKAGQSDLLFSGRAANLLPVLFADSTNSTDAFLDFTAGLSSNNLNIDELLSLFSVQETASQVGQQAVDSLRNDKNEARAQRTDKLKGSFSATFHNFQYGKILGSNFVGLLTFDRNHLYINGNTDAMQGHLALNGEAVFEQAPYLTMRIQASSLDLKTIMEQCNNFDQEVITDKNLRGIATGRMVLYCFWNENGAFDWDKLKAYVDLSATNGELVGLKMLEDFSTFIHIEDLRQVKFTNLQNYLEISNQRLYIPVMFIQSNALNMSLSGVQGFNYDIDYKIKVNAGQTLLNRVKKHDPDLDPLPAEKGMFNIYYTVVGNIDKYEIKRGKKTVKTDFERSEARKQTIAAALEKAFSENIGAPAPAVQ